MMRIINALKTNNKAKIAFRWSEYILLFLYVFSLPAFSARAPWNIISYVLMALLLLNTILSTHLYSSFSWKKHFIVIPAFVLWMLVGTILFSHQYRVVLTLFLLSVTMFTFYFSFRFINDFETISKIIILALITFSLYFLIIYWKSILNFNSFSSETFRLGDYFDNVNHIGTYYSIGVSFSFYFLLFAKKMAKLYSVPGIFFLLLGMTTGSREFVITTILIVFLLLFYKLRKKKLIFLLTVISVFVVAIVLINLPFMSTMKIRFEKMVIALLGGGGEGSTTTRFLWQIYGVVLGSKNIIPGYGAYGFGNVSGVGTYTHANYSEIICNGGIIGFLLFYGYIIYIFGKTFKSNIAIKHLVSTFAVAFVILSPVSIIYTNKETYLLLGFMLAALDTSFKGEVFGTPRSNIINNNETFYMVKI